MVSLLQNYDLTTIIIIFIVIIAAIAGAITWLFNFFNQRNKYKSEEKKKILDEDNYNKRMDRLEANDTKQDEILREHGDMLKLLIRSDKNRIKKEITDYHSKYMALGYIDIHTLSIIHEDFEVYQAEHGNSWIESMVDDLDKLPIKEI